MILVQSVQRHDLLFCDQVSTLHLLEIGDLNLELHVMSQILYFWFLFFSSSLALRSKKSGTDGCSCDWPIGKFARRRRFIRSSAGLKPELKGKLTWPYRGLQLSSKDS